MADAVAVAVAKAVEAHIAAGVAAHEFCRAFTLERSYADWELDQAKMDDLALRASDKLRVDVVGVMTEQKAKASTRGGSLQLTVPVDIVVRQKLGPDKQDDDTGRIEIEEVDALMLLFQQLFMRFTQESLAAANFQYSVWDEENGGTQIKWAPNRMHLRDLRQFTSWARVTFRADVKAV